jgi:hypothetical protein
MYQDFWVLGNRKCLWAIKLVIILKLKIPEKETQSNYVPIQAIRIFEIILKPDFYKVTGWI